MRCIQELSVWNSFLDEHYTELELGLEANDGAYVGDDYAIHKCPNGKNEDETENGPCKCDYGESTFDASDGKCKYTVALDKNGGRGTIHGAVGTQNASIQCIENEPCSFGSAAGLSQTGYTFKTGWGTDPTCTETTYSFTNPTAGTYYACKTANNYEITLNNTNATGGMTKIYTTYNTNVYLNSGRTQKMTTTTNPVTKPTLSNATFLGYYDSASGTTQYINADGFITSAGISAAKSVSGNNISWYAKWQTQASTVTITLSDGTDATGGSGSISVVGGVKYLNGQQMTTNSNPVAVPAKSNGFAFLGYYNSASGTTQYIDENGYITTAGINATISGTTTWYARFSTSCVVINLDNTTYCDNVGNLPTRLYRDNTCSNSSCPIYTNASCTTQFNGFNSNSFGTTISVPPFKSIVYISQAAASNEYFNKEIAMSFSTNFRFSSEFVDFINETIFSCFIITPLGFPVDPEVYIKNDTSSGVIFT